MQEQPFQDQPFTGSTEISPFDPATPTRHNVRRRFPRRPISAWARPGRAQESRSRAMQDDDPNRPAWPQNLYRVLSPAQSNAAINAAWNVTQRLQRETAIARRRTRQAVLVAAGGWLCAALLTAGGILASQRTEENFVDVADQSQRLVEQLHAQREVAATAAQQRDALRAELLTAHASDSDLNVPNAQNWRPSVATLDITR